MQLVLSNLFQLNSGLFFFGRGFAKSCSDSSAISCPDGRIMPVIRCFSMVMFCKRGLRERALQEALFLAAEKKALSSHLVLGQGCSFLLHQNREVFRKGVLSPFLHFL